MKLELNTVYNIDCKELMQEMIKQGIKADWVITDPPYGTKAGSMARKGWANKWVGEKAQRRTYDLIEWDNERISKEYFDLMFQCSNNQIIFGGNYYTDILPPTANWAIWDKRCSDNAGTLSFYDCEMAWTSTGGGRIFRYLYNGMVQGDMANKDERFHPTQKPTQLWYKLLNYYTKPNDLILDPFMGSFTTAVACAKSGRRFIGAELDKKYFEKGQERLRKATAQESIFDLIGKEQ